MWIVFYGKKAISFYMYTSMPFLKRYFGLFIPQMFNINICDCVTVPVLTVYNYKWVGNTFCYM